MSSTGGLFDGHARRSHFERLTDASDPQYQPAHLSHGKRGYCSFQVKVSVRPFRLPRCLTNSAAAARMSGSSWNFGGDPRLTIRQ
jgi:hypothetical protein